MATIERRETGDGTAYWTTRVFVGLLLALLLAGCTVEYTYRTEDPAWYTRYGAAHGVIAAGIVIGVEGVAKKPWYAAIATCAYYLGREGEETKGFRHFEWGVWDSAGDVVTPCATGALLSWVLERRRAEADTLTAGDGR